MSIAIDHLSIGRAVDLLARALHWSPVGRTLALHGAEGPSAGEFAGLTGNVDSVDNHGVIVIRRARRDSDEKAGTFCLRLSPRHKGWTAYSLMLVRIAVVAELVGSDGRAQSATIAIASIGRNRV
jgi:hypothetical protein